MKTARSKLIFHILLFFALPASLLGSAVFVTPAYAASLVVDSLADTTAVDSSCTLREAIQNAKDDAATNADCAAGSGTDTISFAPGLSGGTIYLGSTLTIDSDLTIDGSALASQVSISGDSDQNGNGNVRVFTVNSGATVMLNSLTITKGSSSDTLGGGIYNNAGSTLTVTNSTLSNNTTTGGPGGGIKNDGTLTVTNSTFSGNTTTGSGSGGGIRNAGALTVTNSTFSGNSAVGSGGGIYNVSGFTSVTITNSTFSGNAAGSTGGGIYYTSTGTFSYANTIIANSISGGDCAGDTTINLVTNTNNLVEDGSCSTNGTNFLSGNPGLDSLADNGGPSQTFALINGSPAIDAGDDTTCTNSPVSNLDQRGTARPVGAHCDIGAFEGSVPDTVAPSVSSFTATSPSTSLNIPITAFTASDNVAVSGYIITASATPPSSGDSGWTGSAPSTYTVGSLGSYNLYPWAKDGDGNVSSIYGSPAAVTVCNASTTVTSNADSGAGTLRQAIADTCPGGSITFYVALSGTTIHLASTLTLAKDVTIDGSALAGQITISGDNAVRVFSVNSGVTATMNSLAITKGSNFSGGGIRNDGTLTITNSTISDNAATSGGGGIFNTGSGTLTVTNSTLSGNSAGSGGGIHNQGTLTVTNSTLSGNSASSSGGGLFNNGGALDYANTIIANSAAGGDCVNGGTGTIGTNTNNLVEDASCSALLSGDPNLGSLADNGGPTQTLALLTGSPAIDTGDTTACAASPVSNLDQRGVTRPQGAQCDIGAYEYQYHSIVTKLADTDDGICNSDCSLREAIATAVNGQTITFDSSLSGGTIHLASTLNIVQNMTIDGSALASKITVSGEGAVRVFFVHSGMTVTLDSLRITNGNGTDPSAEGFTGGGGIQNNSGNSSGVVLTVKNSVISGNSADTGGGIYNRDQSTITITNSTISGNVAATGNGGGIYSDGTLTVTNSTVSGNSATGDGGGIRDGSTTTITNSTLSGNSASGSGGGIFNAGALTMRNSTLSGNSASASNGGGFYGNNTFNATNNIIANSTSGADCAGEIDTNLNNLVEDGSCSDNGVGFLTGDPSLGALAANGGPTLTLALGLGSSAIDAGDATTCANSPVNNLDQRGVSRPVGAQCDIGAFEGAQDITAPTVSSIARVTTSPTAKVNVQFLVTFSEPVTGISSADFSLTKPGITGGSITSVTGSGTTRTVTVNTGSGNGTLRLDIPNGATITDVVGNALGGLPYTGGGMYVVNKTLTFNSISTQDGWILESTETSGAGGSLNNIAATFRLGDDANNRQYRAILSFATATLPDNATLTSAVLTIKQNGAPLGTNPFTVLGNLFVDIRQGTFGAAALQLADFNSIASASAAGAFNSTPVSGVYRYTLSSSARGFINRTGGTQFRLRFRIDDNNNHVADYMNFLSGDFTGAGKPQLIVTYTVP